MKKILLTSVVLLCALCMQALDYPYMVFKNAEGTNTVLSVDQLTMQVNGSSLQVTNKEGNETFQLTDLSMMYFSQTITALENVLNADEPVSVYSLTGVALGRFSSVHEAVQALGTGVYVMTNGKNQQKIIVQ